MRLIVIEGADLGMVFVFADVAKLLGRGRDADICLQGRGVSRRHARLARASTGDAVVLDLGSANGTYVNEVPIKTAVLRAGDRLRLGFDVVLQVERHASDERDTIDLVETANADAGSDEVTDLRRRCLEMNRPRITSGQRPERL